MQPNISYKDKLTVREISLQLMIQNTIQHDDMQKKKITPGVTFNAQQKGLHKGQ